MKIECRSFGFKNGADTNVNLLFDVRCLENPYYIETLKHKTGLDKQVRDYVFGFEQSQTYFKKIVDTVLFLLPQHTKKADDKFVVAFGCTGGHHRSVTFAVALCAVLRQKGYDANCFHRDIDKED